ncbi:MAG: SEC-C domain-containing protein, partial [Clostridiales bacterium]|nr:SEC-C domain-containing protein [Clostridiales bacterium]
MKTGRNEPCPCGSGKKYKHCCYQKNHDNSNEEGLAIEEELRDKDHDEAYNESMLRGLLNFRMFFLGRKPHIKEYYKVRKMHGEICGAMIEYYDEGKFQLKIDSPFIADKSKKPDAARKRREIRLIDNHFDFETIEGLKGFQDRIIYRHALNMNCVTEDFIRLHRYR